MSSPVITPMHIGFVAWANQLWLSFDVFLPLATSEETWQEWAASVYALSTLEGVPNPSDFKNWRDWAALVLNSKKKSIP